LERGAVVSNLGCSATPPQTSTADQRTHHGESAMTTLQSVQGILQANFELAPAALQPDAKLEDLAIDSLSLIELMFAVEDEFKVVVPSQNMKLLAEIKTIRDLVAYVDALIAEQHPALAGGAVAKCGG